MHNNIRYCIACQEEIAVEDGVEGHTVLVGDFPFEIDFCHGPFATSLPPENFDQDWDFQDEPTGDELFVMNLAAEQLMLDFEMEG